MINMKKLKRTLVILFSILLTISTNAQDLDKMPQQKRDSALRAIAKKTIEKYGPAFYRPTQTIKVGIMDKESFSKSLEYYHEALQEGDTEIANGYAWAKKLKDGHKWYIVTYHYNDKEESFDASYAAEIYIWADNGKAFAINFGSNMCRYGIDKIPDDEYVRQQEWTKRGAIIIDSSKRVAQQRYMNELFRLQRLKFNIGVKKNKNKSDSLRYKEIVDSMVYLQEKEKERRKND